MWEADQSREVGNLFSSGEPGWEPGGLRGSQPPPSSPDPHSGTHLCGAGGCQGWIPIPIPAVLAGSPVPRVLDTPSQAGTGSAGKEGEGSEEGSPYSPGHPQGGSWGHPHLKHHNFAIICLQVEGPGGGDEALGRADNVVAEGGDQIQHGKRRRFQLQALQRSGDITSALSPRHPPRRATSHPELMAGLSRVQAPRDGKGCARAMIQSREGHQEGAVLPGVTTQPWGHHSARGASLWGGITLLCRRQWERSGRGAEGVPLLAASRCPGFLAVAAVCYF